MQAGARHAARPAAPPGCRAAPRARGRARAPRAALPGADLAPRPAAADPAALAFLDEATGERIPAMPADYGFRSGSGRLYQDGYGGVPRPALALAAANFVDEAAALRRAVRLGDEPDAAGDAAAAAAAGAAGRALAAAAGAARRAAARADAWLEARGVLGPVPAAPAPPGGPVPPAAAAVLDAVRALTLDDRAVARREAAREAAEGAVAAPAPIRLAYGMLIWSIDVLYAGRPIQRFWFLETVARMPYFAFISMLHLYESLGWWRAGAELRRVHFAEEWNELHHLQIMEALGGDRRWADRFLAEHAAVFYYWVLVVMYLVAPSASYAFCELVEVHAETTYAEFCEENAAALAALPPPLAALAYYKGGDLYLFDTLQTECRVDAGGCEPRRPPCNTLLDVFRNIRDDEREHVKTMAACKSGRVALDARGWELGRADGGVEVDVAAGAGRASAGAGGGGGGDGAGRSG